MMPRTEPIADMSEVLRRASEAIRAQRSTPCASRDPVPFPNPIPRDGAAADLSAAAAGAAFSLLPCSPLRGSPPLAVRGDAAHRLSLDGFEEINAGEPRLAERA